MCLLLAFPYFSLQIKQYFLIQAFIEMAPNSNSHSTVLSMCYQLNFLTGFKFVPFSICYDTCTLSKGILCCNWFNRNMKLFFFRKKKSQVCTANVYHYISASLSLSFSLNSVEKWMLQKQAMIEHKHILMLSVTRLTLIRQYMSTAKNCVCVCVGGYLFEIF